MSNNLVPPGAAWRFHECKCRRFNAAHPHAKLSASAPIAAFLPLAQTVALSLSAAKWQDSSPLAYRFFNPIHLEGTNEQHAKTRIDDDSGHPRRDAQPERRRREVPHGPDDQRIPVRHRHRHRGAPWIDRRRGRDLRLEEHGCRSQAASLVECHVTAWPSDLMMSGNTKLEDIPRLMAQYALAAPADMRNELAERIGLV